MIGKPYRSYVAIGDSLSEGLGDFSFDIRREQNGWTDRVANILAAEAAQAGYEFHYANLALRGTKLSTIMQDQLRNALKLQPDLVTVMAGSNDLLSKQPLHEIREELRLGLMELMAAGCDVVVATTINPNHLRVFRPLLPASKAFSAMISDVAEELGLPVLDVHGISGFDNLYFWAKDMVHFSGHGHIRVANQAAQLLRLGFRYPEIAPTKELARGALETLSWIARDVMPFVSRKLRGVTSGDGMVPKQQGLIAIQPLSDDRHWSLVNA